MKRIQGGTEIARRCALDGTARWQEFGAGCSSVAAADEKAVLHFGNFGVNGEFDTLRARSPSEVARGPERGRPHPQRVAKLAGIPKRTHWKMSKLQCVQEGLEGRAPL